MVYFNEEVMESCTWLKKMRMKKKVDRIEINMMAKEYWEENILNDSYMVIQINRVKVRYQIKIQL